MDFRDDIKRWIQLEQKRKNAYKEYLSVLNEMENVEKILWRKIPEGERIKMNIQLSSGGTIAFQRNEHKQHISQKYVKEFMQKWETDHPGFDSAQCIKKFLSALPTKTEWNVVWKNNVK